MDKELSEVIMRPPVDIRQIRISNYKALIHMEGEHVHESVTSIHNPPSAHATHADSPLAWKVTTICRSKVSRFFGKGRVLTY